MHSHRLRHCLSPASQVAAVRCGSSPGQLLCNLIDCDIVSHRQVKSLRSGAEATLGSSYAISSTTTLSLTSKSSRFGSSRGQVLKLSWAAPRQVDESRSIVAFSSHCAQGYRLRGARHRQRAPDRKPRALTYAVCLTLLRLHMHLSLEHCVHAARCAATCSCRMAA